MIEIIYKYEATIRLCLFMGGFAVLALWEFARPDRALTRRKIRRWASNIGLIVTGTILIRVLVPVAAVSSAYLVEMNQWGLVNQADVPFWAKVVITFILLDLSIYFQHAVFHVIPLMWRFHRVHHSDVDCDVTTGLRFHPIEIVISILFKVTTILLLGAPVLAVILFEAVLNFMSMFTHSNIRLNKTFEPVLRWFIVTPDMHRIHHSVEENETNSNFGFNISLWDRLLGTYMQEPKDGQQGLVIGLDHFREPKWQGLTGLLRIPFATSVRGYAINYRDTKNADELALAKKITLKNQENERLVSELHRLNEELESRVEERTRDLTLAKEEAEKANIAKSAFLSNMSHELRTPLNAVIGYAELLMENEESPLNDEQKLDMEKISGAGTHLLELINEILDLARLESGHASMPLKSIDMERIITDTLHLIVPMAGKRGIKIDYQNEGELLFFVKGNTRSLKEVMLNLLSNSIKYNIDNGVITIRIEHKADDRLRVSITDTGYGLSEEQQRDLFKPFNRAGASDAIEGTGIGLTISRKLVELMGGAIGVISETGKGSVFWFEIPLSDEVCPVKTFRKAAQGG